MAEGIIEGRRYHWGKMVSLGAEVSLVAGGITGEESITGGKMVSQGQNFGVLSSTSWFGAL